MSCTGIRQLLRGVLSSEAIKLVGRLDGRIQLRVNEITLHWDDDVKSAHQQFNLNLKGFLAAYFHTNMQCSNPFLDSFHLLEIEISL
jgi:hypothetical protein